MSSNPTPPASISPSFAPPPQPNQQFYSLDYLIECPLYGSRSAFTQATGQQPPSFDSSYVDANGNILVQEWFDPAVATALANGLDPTTPYSYLTDKKIPGGAFVLVTDELVTVTIPAFRAAVPNLPGLATFPPYVIAQTTASSGGALINPLYLSTLAQANAMVATMTALGCKVSGPTFEDEVTYPTTELRKVYDIVVNGQVFNVGAMLQSQYAAGMGSPGAWALVNQQILNGAPVAGTGTPIWVPVNPGPDGISRGIPTGAQNPPYRPLASNETLEGFWGNVTYVVQTAAVQGGLPVG